MIGIREEDSWEFGEGSGERNDEDDDGVREF